MPNQSNPIHPVQGVAIGKSELKDKIESMPANDRQWLSENLDYVSEALEKKKNSKKEPQ